MKKRIVFKIKNSFNDPHSPTFNKKRSTTSYVYLKPIEEYLEYFDYLDPRNI